MLIDTHCHLDFADFDPDRDQVLQNAFQMGVFAIIQPGTVARSFIPVIFEDPTLLATHTLPNHLPFVSSSVFLYLPPRCISKSFGYRSIVQQTSAFSNALPVPTVYPCYGLHPCFIDAHEIADLITLEEMICQYNPIALGECGLDFFLPDLMTHDLREKQCDFFEAQLKLARQYQLPLIIHARKSLDQVILLIRKVNKLSMVDAEIRSLPALKGVIHSFSGSLVQANILIDLGFYLGFGGPITYPRATKLQMLVKILPLEMILLESDAPDQPISQDKGLRNTPSSVFHVCQTIADIRQETFEVIAHQTTVNAERLFCIDIRHL